MSETIEVEALRRLELGPDEILLVSLDHFPSREVLDRLSKILDKIIGVGRYVIHDRNVEFSVIKKPPDFTPIPGWDGTTEPF